MHSLTYKQLWYLTYTDQYYILYERNHMQIPWYRKCKDTINATG